MESDVHVMRQKGRKMIFIAFIVYMVLLLVGLSIQQRSMRLLDDAGKLILLNSSTGFATFRALIILFPVALVILSLQFLTTVSNLFKIALAFCSVAPIAFYELAATKKMSTLSLPVLFKRRLRLSYRIIWTGYLFAIATIILRMQ